jgi:ribonuclease VapC
MKYVADSSALLALLNDEHFTVDLQEMLTESVMCSINYSEVVDYFALSGLARKDITAILETSEIDIISADAQLAIEAGLMRPITKQAGLSIADRFCIALAIKLGLPALTGDRKWSQIAETMGVEIILIR